MAPIALDRSQVLAHRMHAHGLVERAARVEDLAVLDLGVQNSPPGALPVALSARLTEPLAPDDDLTAGGALTVVWSHRGAPHLHRTAELPALAAACWPRDDADAAARLGWQRKRLAEVGGAARAGYRTVALAVAEVLAGADELDGAPGVTKSALSTEVTRRIPAELSPFCTPCGVHHVGEQLLRLAGLPGGLRLRAGAARPLVLEPLPDWPGPPADDAAGTAAVQDTHLRLQGPASAADTADFLGTSAGAVGPDRPDGLVAVTVDGRAGELSDDQLAEVQEADPGSVAGLLRLLPPSDPFLQGRDRALLLPDPAQRKRLWTAIGGPGALLCGADVAGLWRATVKGKRLTLAVSAFRALTKAEQTTLDDEAQRLATVRGTAGATVEVSRD